MHNPSFNKRCPRISLSADPYGYQEEGSGGEGGNAPKGLVLGFGVRQQFSVGCRGWARSLVELALTAHLSWLG